MNLVEALTREIERVTELREQYREIQAMSDRGDFPNKVLTQPAVAGMTQALEAAHQAMAEHGDIEKTGRALKRLQDFTG
ncbi:MAG: hypothetical protein OXH56_00190 [Gemmatimonadetes bacterium]|nr:hypothetical protein [Gemmatimonadota bacterium]